MFVITLYDGDTIVKQYFCDSFETLFDYFKKNGDMFFKYMDDYDFSIDMYKLKGAKYLSNN